MDEWEWGEEAKSIIAQPQVNKPSSRGFSCGTDAHVERVWRGSGCPVERGTCRLHRKGDPPPLVPSKTPTVSPLGGSRRDISESKSKSMSNID